MQLREGLQITDTRGSLVPNTLSVRDEATLVYGFTDLRNFDFTDVRRRVADYRFSRSD